MSDTLWFDVKPGETVTDVTNQMGGGTEGHVLLVHQGCPDWVRLPPELGGQQVRVLRAEQGTCPCGKHVTRILVLDEPSGIKVAECPAVGYQWFRQRSQKPGPSNV